MNNTAPYFPGIRLGEADGNQTAPSTQIHCRLPTAYTETVTKASSGQFRDCLLNSVSL